VEHIYKFVCVSVARCAVEKHGQCQLRVSAVEKHGQCQFRGNGHNKNEIRYQATRQVDGHKLDKQSLNLQCQQ
jgi:hypothetical protein